MENIITIIQVSIAIILIVIVLMQNKGGGLSGVFGGGGSGGGGADFRTKRGTEKTLHILTIIFSILFLAISLANILIRA